jgi:hypothetical protein
LALPPPISHSLNALRASRMEYRIRTIFISIRSWAGGTHKVSFSLVEVSIHLKIAVSFPIECDGSHPNPCPHGGLKADIYRGENGTAFAPRSRIHPFPMRNAVAVGVDVRTIPPLVPSDCLAGRAIGALKRRKIVRTSLQKPSCASFKRPGLAPTRPTALYTWECGARSGSARIAVRLGRRTQGRPCLAFSEPSPRRPSVVGSGHD